SLRKQGLTLAKLQLKQDQELELLGIDKERIKALRSGSRPEIPRAALIQVLLANRFTCCVCHDPDRSIVVHHIRPWSESHDHGESNLAVMCLEHHDKAHSVSSL